jgi:hypothetical protein
MTSVQTTLKKIMAGIGRQEKADGLARCLMNVIHDIEKID